MKNKIIPVVFFCISILQVNSQSWSLTGNGSTNPPTNFLGTTDAKNLVFKTNGILSGIIDIANSNTSFGQYDFSAMSGGTNNSAFGTWALRYNTSGTGNAGFGIYALQSNTTGSGNSATGDAAIVSNTSGSYNAATGYTTMHNNTIGNNNAAFGSLALYSNVGAHNNTSIGYNTLYSNVSGYSNVAVGVAALKNTAVNNNIVAVGDSALWTFSFGSANTAVGSKSLYSLDTGSANTAHGFQALYTNIADSNTATGYKALYSNTTGTQNTAIGARAFYINTTGSNNVAIGHNATANANNYSNATAIGANAIVTASNKMQLGNTVTATIATSGGYTIASDGRFKDNVKSDVLGLSFILKLNPVTYNFNYSRFDDFQRKNLGERKPTSAYQNELKQKSEKREIGFIAQEVEKICKESNAIFNGVYAPQNENDNYSLDYSKFVVPLVKAVQELSTQNEEKQTQINKLSDQISQLQLQLANVLQELPELKRLPTVASAELQQNSPNPFNSSTTIRYSLASKNSSGIILVSNSVGQIIKTIALNSSGEGQVIINSKELVPGSYFYSLIVDGKKMDTKKMVIY